MRLVGSLHNVSKHYERQCVTICGWRLEFHILTEREVFFHCFRQSLCFFFFSPRERRKLLLVLSRSRGIIRYFPLIIELTMVDLYWSQLNFFHEEPLTYFIPTLCFQIFDKVVEKNLV